MKIICLNVEALFSEPEKNEVRKSFKQLGWGTDVHWYFPEKLAPKGRIDYFQFTWFDNTDPPYPKIPDGCVMSML